MNHEEFEKDLQEGVIKELKKGSSGIAVTAEGRTISIQALEKMSGEDFIETCKVIVRGEKACISKYELRDSTGKPTGKYGFFHNWKSTGGPSGAKELKNMNAIDCLKSIYGTTRCYDNKTGWRI